MLTKWIFLLILVPSFSVAAPKIVTTTTTLKSLVEELVGDKAEVISITRGPQDPHYVEAKPSFFVKMRDADLMLSVGLELEVGWLPSLLRGARNPKIMPDQSGFLEVSQFVDPIEVVKGKIDRSQGDVHGAGNPHFLLNPNQVEKVVKGLNEKIPLAIPELKSVVEKRSDKFLQKLKDQRLNWEQDLEQSGQKKLVTYHRTLNDFFEFAGIQFVGAIESKPGIPPTAKQTIALIAKMKKQKVNCILVESFFEIYPAQRIQKETGAGISVIPVEVQALSKAKDYWSLMDSIVSGIKNCKAGKLHRE